MEEKIKLYVDSNEKGFIDDCYLADNTKIICEFNHEESEIEYSDCKLLNLREYDKLKDQRIAELEQDLEFTTKTANELIEIKHKLEQELAELKEKAIVPKFKIGQNIFFIDNEYQITQGVVDVILTGQDVFERWCKYSIDLGLEYEDDIRFVDKDEEEIFATKEEAQDKLKEMKGNE